MTHPEMSEVTPLIFISGCSSARDMGRFFDVIVNVACDAPVFGAHHFKLVDGPGNDIAVFNAAVECAKEQIRFGRKMLIHCVGGRSRSVTVLAAAMQEELDLPFADTVERIRGLRAKTTLPMEGFQPHKALVELWKRRSEGST